ncbi:MAG: N-acetylmuramoyl-L-alanine amidase [Cyanobacteria bacterium P01_D01_bin.73]
MAFDFSAFRLRLSSAAAAIAVLGSLTGSLAIALPARADRLVRWDFEASRGQLTFITDEPVRPQARIIDNPRRLVIDLPGINWSRSTAERLFRGAVRSVRVGQVEPGVTRLVVELAPNEQLSSDQVRVQHLGGNRWSIQGLPTAIAALPSPLPPRQSPPRRLPPPRSSPPRRLPPPVRTVPSPPPRRQQRQERWVPGALAEVMERNRQRGINPGQASGDAVTVTDFSVDGDALRLRVSGGTPEVQAYDGVGDRQLIIDVENAGFSSGTIDRLVNRLGVARAILSQAPGRRVRLTLNLVPNSPEFDIQTDRNNTVVIKPIPGTARRPRPRPGGGNFPGTLPTVQGQRLVIIDPGHGGRDPGAIGLGGLQEKGVVLDISRQVASLLQQQGVAVVMTRSDDRFITLQGRTAIANRTNASAFVSIHANAISLSRTDVNGVETYYFSNNALAQSIHQSIRRTFPEQRDRGVKRARFFVIRRTRMPASLVEVGFVTGDQDSIWLRDPQWRSRMARAIAIGILNYLR